MSNMHAKGEGVGGGVGGIGGRGRGEGGMDATRARAFSGFVQILLAPAWKTCSLKCNPREKKKKKSHKASGM